VPIWNPCHDADPASRKAEDDLYLGVWQLSPALVAVKNVLYMLRRLLNKDLTVAKLLLTLVIKDKREGLGQTLWLSPTTPGIEISKPPMMGGLPFF